MQPPLHSRHCFGFQFKHGGTSSQKQKSTKRTSSKGWKSLHAVQNAQHESFQKLTGGDRGGVLAGDPIGANAATPASLLPGVLVESMEESGEGG